MKRSFLSLTACLLVLCLLAGCSFLPTEETERTETPTFPETITMIQTEPETEPETETETEPETEMETESETQQETEPEAGHSALYLSDVPVEDVITYFNEVCLDCEYVLSGDPSYVQKWVTPIYYSIDGGCTPKDLAKVEEMAALLNEIEGFPGIYPADEETEANMRIHFWSFKLMMEEMGHYVNGDESDALFHFLYNGNNEIFDVEICVRTDVDQRSRDAFILHELCNSLGPGQDSMLRTDSIIYQGHITAKELTDVDLLLLQLLYHPDMLCGMDAAACEQVIRSLYY